LDLSSIEARLEALQAKIDELRQKEVEARRGLEEIEELSRKIKERRGETVEARERLKSARERLKSRRRETRQSQEKLSKSIREIGRKREGIIEAQKKIKAKRRRVKKRVKPQIPKTEPTFEGLGLPGPGRGYRPGSIGAKVTKKVGTTLTDIQITLATTPPPPGPGRGYRPGSIGAKVQRDFEKAFIAQEKAMTRLQTKMEVSIGGLRSRAEKEPFFAGAYTATALGLKFGKGFIAGFTYPFRPLKIRESLVGLTTLLTSEQMRTEAAHLAFVRFKGDPIGSIFETAGMFAGPYVLEKGIGVGVQKIREYQTTKFLETYPIEDFLPGEMEIHAQYPTPYEARAFVITRERVELGAGFLEAHKWRKGSGGLSALITEHERYLRRIYSYPVTEHLPGLRIGFPSITRPLGKVSLFPIALTGIGTALTGIPSIDKPIFEQITKTVQKPKPIQIERAKEKPFQIARPKIEPGYVIKPIIEPKPKEETWIAPGYKPFPVTITIPRPVIVFPPRPIPILRQPPIQPPLQPPPMLIPLKTKPPRLPIDTYRPRRKKRRKAKKEKWFGLLEVRVDPLETKGIKKRKLSLKEVLRF